MIKVPILWVQGIQINRSIQLYGTGAKAKWWGEPSGLTAIDTIKGDARDLGKSHVPSFK